MFIKLSAVYKIRLREECTATKLEAIMWKIDELTEGTQLRSILYLHSFPSLKGTG